MLHHDADFTTRLDGIRLLHTFELVHDAFEFFQPPRISLHHFASCAGPRARERIGGIDERRQNRFRLDVFMMRRDRVDDLRRLAVLAGQFGADDRVGAFDFMIHRLADIVQECRATGLFFIQA